MAASVVSDQLAALARPRADAGTLVADGVPARADSGSRLSGISIATIGPGPDDVKVSRDRGMIGGLWTTVTLTIDGQPVTVEKGKTVLQAAIEHGFSVPYYCYHPGLGIDGSCRVCIVKIEKMAKLQTACSTTCTDGMVVSTDAPDVVQARAGVFEFLLVNHPLDCPVCDKGGECPLQDFSYSFGPSDSRMEFPRRTFDGEGVKADVDFGPTLMLNRNRCILCTRCVRFMQEVDADAQIGIVARGNDSQIATFDEEGVHSLLSGNLMDVCPVGAITTRDYRFKSRPWDNPDAVDTICTLCSKGCSTTAWIKAKPEWAKGARLVRFTPRYEPDVNGYWMCDIGRFGYHWIEGDERLQSPLVREGAGHQQATTWDAALKALGERASAVAGAGLHLPGVGARVERRDFPHRAAGQRDRGELDSRARSSSRRARSSRCRRVDAPNVNGARDLGLPVGDGNDGAPDLGGAAPGGRSRTGAGALRRSIPGPTDRSAMSSWVAAARQSGKLSLLVYQGVLDVRPGAGRRRRAARRRRGSRRTAPSRTTRGACRRRRRCSRPPGDALDDREIFFRVATALGQPLP